MESRLTRLKNWWNEKEEYQKITDKTDYYNRKKATWFFFAIFVVLIGISVAISMFAPESDKLISTTMTYATMQPFSSLMSTSFILGVVFGILAAICLFKSFDESSTEKKE